MDLKGKVAVIIGGARMGESLGVYLAQRGCRIVLGYRHSQKSALKAVASICRKNGKAKSCGINLRNQREAKFSFEKIQALFGRVDIVINMASSYSSESLNKITEHSWEERFHSNLTSGFWFIQAAQKELLRRHGRIVNFSDWVAASGRPRYKNFVSYFTAKSAVEGLTQSLALDLAPHVLVNAIAPGPILPPSEMSSYERKHVAQSTPLGKWGGVEEISKAVAFLCETDFVTGETLRVDGGRHLY